MALDFRKFGLKIAKLSVILHCLSLVPLGASCLADESRKSNEATEDDRASSTKLFYQKLDVILSDFEIDLKSGQASALKDLAIRNVVTGENTPTSFRSRLELLLTEKILKLTRTRVVHCLACRSKTTFLNTQTMKITSDNENQAEMKKMATLNGIQVFLDVALADLKNGMVLSLQASDVSSGALLWSRTYRSETTRDLVDSDDVNIRQLIQLTPILYMGLAPKPLSGYSSILGFGFRMAEPYFYRQREVGLELNYYSAKTNPYADFNLTFLIIHGWSLAGKVEDSNQAQGLIFGGIGGTFGTGFLGALIRAGYEWRLVKNWSVLTFLGYRTQFSGPEAGIGLGFNF